MKELDVDISGRKPHLPYAEARPEIAALCPGERVLALEATRSWQEVMVPVLDEVEARRRAPRPGEKKRRGWGSPYTAHDFERLEVLRRVLGMRATKETRDWLASDRGARTRKLLGFDQPRKRHGGREQQLMHGIPADSVMSTYRTRWFREEERVHAWKLLDRALREEDIETVVRAATEPGGDPSLLEEFDVITADGSKLETHFTTAKYKPHPQYPKDKSKRICVNADKVTSDGGYIPPSATNADHSGSGWNLVFAPTANGRALSWVLEDLHESESESLIRQVNGQLGESLALVDELTAKAGSTGTGKLRVLSTDNAFHCQELRTTAAEGGIATNIHLASHGGPEGSAWSKKLHKDRFAIDGYPNWETTGHRELVCKCGEGKTYRRGVLAEAGKSGRRKAVLRIEGECGTCGPITITAGKWRTAQNPKRMTRVQPGDTEVDWTFGNPLTYYDPLASEYGRKRWATHEGMNGSQLTQRYQLLKTKRWFRRRTQAETEVAMVFSLLHALAIEGHRQKRGDMPSARPPLAAAA